MIDIPNLDMFIVQTCNLSCAGCQTFSDSKLVKGVTRYNNDYLEFWSSKIQPAYINMFGGEPLLNPDLEMWLDGCRQYWPDSNLVIQTNGLRLSEEHLSWIDTYNVSFNISQHMPEYGSKVWNFINQALATGKFQPWTNENGPVQNGYGEQRGWINSDECHIQLTESFNETVWWSFYKNTAEESKPNYNYFSNDFHSSWNVCGCRTFVNMFEGNLYKCPAVAGLLINGDSLGLNEKNTWKDWFNNYKRLNLYSQDVIIDEWFNEQKGPQSCCNMCAHKLDMGAQTVVNSKVKL
tara:strand:- start:1560 stop:2438 length:879 start_codon:yes stop_codon:yes gene_type:complete